MRHSNRLLQLFIALIVCAVLVSCARTRDAAQTKTAYLKRTYKLLQKAIPAEAKLVLVADSIRILFPNNLLFDYNRAVVHQEFMPAINRLAAVFHRRSETSIIIFGHTDAVGGDGTFNLDLSQRRADSVRDVLVAHQVARTRLSTWGRGPKDPIASNETEEGRALNRRVEFVVLYDKPE